MSSKKGTTDSIIFSAAKSLKFENGQSAFNMLSDLWGAVVRFVKECFTNGTGVLLPDIGVFVFRNTVQQDGSIKRVPGFIFADSLVRECMLKVKHREQAPTESKGSLGSVFTLYPPLKALNWASLAQYCSLTSAECRTGYGILVRQLKGTITAHQPVKMDLGAGVLNVVGTETFVELNRALIGTIRPELLTRVVSSSFSAK